MELALLSFRSANFSLNQLHVSNSDRLPQPVW